jgi:hypothetical protein
LHDAFGVMPGLVLGIHVVTGCCGFRTPKLFDAAVGAKFWDCFARPDVDARDKPGHDG